MHQAQHRHPRRSFGRPAANHVRAAGRYDVDFGIYTRDGLTSWIEVNYIRMFTPLARSAVERRDDQYLTNGTGALCEGLDKATPCQLGSPARVFSLGNKTTTGLGHNNSTIGQPLTRA